MNAIEQRAHRTVTQGLEARVAAVEQLIERLSLNTEYLKAKSDAVTRLAVELDTNVTLLMTEAMARRGLSLSARLRALFVGH